jgi:signal transduction histidine kinase/FixJ family two-component response regulator
MRIWEKKAEKEPSGRGVARAALDGASRKELLHEALAALAQRGPTCRIGVWLEADSKVSPQDEDTARFHGMVWDRGNLETPQEWASLSVEPPLPVELLLRGKTVEQDLQALHANPIIGLLVGLRHALWVPIARNEQLKGVILAGSRGKQPECSREHLESVAAELALALGLEEEQRIARLRNKDLGAVRRFLAQQAATSSEDALLSSLVESSTETPAHADGPGAVFAVIGALRTQREKPGAGFSVEFHWRSGDDSWTNAIESEPLANVWRQALDEGRVIGSESRRDGTPGPVTRIVAFPLEWEGQLLGTLVAGLTGSAISLATLDRLELRAALAASALRQRRRKEQESLLASWPSALMDCISEPLLLLDEAGKITAASRGARELTGAASKTNGTEPREFPAQAYLAELFCGRDREHLGKWLRAALDRGAERRGTDGELSRAELHNGVVVRLRLAVPMQGQATAIVLDPVIAGKPAGRADHAEIELQSVIEWLEEGIVLFDVQDNIFAMNSRFEQIAGLTPEESGKFKTLEGLIGRLESHAADPARFAERWRELAQGIQGGLREEFQMALPSPRVLERAVRPVLDRAGRRLGRVEVYRDLTAQRVFHSKLLQTEKLAALGQMVSGIAHELSNPLTSIVGYAHRLLARQDFPGQAEEVRQIYEEAERAGTILRELLLNARETLPERHLLSLNQIVQQVMDLHRFSLTTGKIHVEIDLAPGLPLVQGDSGHLQQVLMNLLGNARQALEQQEGGTIRLRTKKIGERRVLLEVADDGPGIPPAILARIFDPFFTTKPAGVGTGLGLAIVLTVVREHGGQVHVLSPPQGGAVFQIELPAVAESAQHEAIGSPLPERKNALLETADARGRENRFAPALQTRKGARVLVVEDEPTVARLIADVLEEEGMHVDVLLDGREALEHAARQPFDLVICDMKMPGLDGQRFYKSLERSGNPLRERFLFVTGDVIAAQTREFLERHHLPHVAKPFRVEELTEKVHGVLAIQELHERRPAEPERKNAARNG